jgi:hypothetical protein
MTVWLRESSALGKIPQVAYFRPSGTARFATGTLARAMAKKVRTPPPPRKVQVPQRRDTRRGAAGGRPGWMYAAGGALVAALVAAAVLGFVLTRDDAGGGTQTKTTATDYNTLPGVRKTNAPWPPEYEFLADRLLPLDLTTLGGHEGLVLHFHAHLDIFVDGKRVPIPALVGINPGAGYLTELHTHNATGVVHIEAQKKRDFTLGQFMAEWGVFLDSNCVGAYCNGLKWYVDGKQQTGNPGNLVFKPHQEIALVVGKPPAKVPSSYKFAPGE